METRHLEVQRCYHGPARWWQSCYFCCQTWDTLFSQSCCQTRAWGCRHGHPAGPENWGLLPPRQDPLSPHSSTSSWAPRWGHRSLSQPPWREADLLPPRIAVRCLWEKPPHQHWQVRRCQVCVSGGNCECAVGHRADLPVKTCCSVTERVVQWKHDCKYDLTKMLLKVFLFSEIGEVTSTFCQQFSISGVFCEFTPEWHLVVVGKPSLDTQDLQIGK